MIYKYHTTLRGRSTRYYYHRRRRHPSGVLFWGKMRSIEESFYKTKSWKNCRSTFLQLNPFCEKCMSKGRYTPATHVHHKIYLTAENYNDPEISLNHENLMALCHECHNKIHFGRADRRYSFDADGRLIIADSSLTTDRAGKIPADSPPVRKKRADTLGERCKECRNTGKKRGGGCRYGKV